MMPVDHRSDIIQSGINFMRSITEAYGTDEGMKLWDTIADTLDKDIKGDIFFALLTGDYSGIITISSCTNWANKIAMIKAIRTVDRRGLGLKEAKDMCDNLQTANKSIRLEIDARNRNQILKTLRDAGFNV